MRDSIHAESSSAIHGQRNKHSRPRSIVSGLGLFLLVFCLIYCSIFIMVPAVVSEVDARERSAVSGPAVVVKDLDVIILSTYSEVMRVGEFIGITASTPGGIPVVWESANPKVATVDSEGVVHGLKKGKTRIIARTEGASATCTVRVKKVTKRRQ